MNDPVASFTTQNVIKLCLKFSAWNFQSEICNLPNDRLEIPSIFPWPIWLDYQQKKHHCLGAMNGQPRNPALSLGSAHCGGACMGRFIVNTVIRRIEFYP